jgi:hypothetical protein
VLFEYLKTLTAQATGTQWADDQHRSMLEPKNLHLALAELPQLGAWLIG